ncbi:MAG: threonine--tRNA ligase [Pseudomonadota bacterium]|nr:threonine--tRNA ligase [Pseudomonadota bacterium]
MGDELYKLRHSLAHVLAQAVKTVYPQVRLGFGPPTAEGFYYDFDFDGAELTTKHLKKLEQQMRKIIQQRQVFTREDCSYQQARKRLADEPYKREQVESLHARGIKNFSFYNNAEKFRDLCEGPHVADTGELPVDCFKLDRISGAYWLGDEKNKMLTRIYGLAFTDAQSLAAYLQRRQYAEKYDHKKLCQELEICMFDDRVGKGMPLWLPNGTVIKDEIERYAKELEFHYGYQRVSTPHLAKESLYLQSQHLPAYQESMFPALQADAHKFYLKPMNCPHHHLIYASRKRSYRELPMRLAEFGTCYRYEQSGELSGLLRVRSFTMNDAHIYLRVAQLKDEFKAILRMHQEFYDKFSLQRYRIRLSTSEQSADKYLGGKELWRKAEQMLQSACEEEELDYFVGSGEAAFYGPKVDFQFKNLLGREETLSTIQLDFLSPQNFHLTFTDEQGNDETPVIIHRAPLSTHERFISMLLEYYGGAMPSWCAPLQVMLLPVKSDCIGFATEVKERLLAKQVRVRIDTSQSSFSKKIKNSAKQKIPFQLVIGDKEVANRSITMRRHGLQEQQTKSYDETIALIVSEIEQRQDPRKPRMADFCVS